MTLKQALRWLVVPVCILMGSLTGQAQSSNPTVEGKVWTVGPHKVPPPLGQI